MNTRIATLKLLPALLLLPIFAAGCDKAENPVAPSGSVLNLSANPVRISPTGQSTLTINGFRPDGNRLNPGTQIRLTASLGNLSANIVEIGADGFATAILRGDGRSGDSDVVARLVTDTSTDGGATLKVNISGAPTVTIVVDNENLDPEDTTFVTFFARDDNNLSLGAGEVIQVAASLGSLTVGGREVTSVITDSAGRAVARYEAGENPGTATITAFTGSSEPATKTITIRDVEDEMTVTYDDLSIPNGGKINISVVVFNSAGRAAPGILVSFSASVGGSFNPSSQVTNGQGQVTTEFTLNDSNVTTTRFTITVRAGRLSRSQEVIIERGT